MNDPTGSSSSPEPLTQSQAPTGYLVRHNETIIGIFDNELDANDAMNGYQMQNTIQLDDTLEIIQVI